RADVTTVTVMNNNIYTGASNNVYLAAGSHTIAWMSSSWAGSGAGNISEDPAWDGTFHLAPKTPSGLGHTRKGGLDLSGYIGTDDKAGYKRPVGSPWDVGAYKYISQLDAPKNLRIAP